MVPYSEGKWAGFAGCSSCRLVQSSRQDMKLTHSQSCHYTVRETELCTICISEQELTVWAFCFWVFCSCVGFFCLFCFVLFLVQHNLERLKAFQPKCGEKTGKALFLHKTSIPNSANESGTSYNGERSYTY